MIFQSVGAFTSLKSSLDNEILSNLDGDVTFL